jgi:hypothetical protein
MNIKFIVLEAELNPGTAAATFLGSLVTRHEYVGVVFDSATEAKEYHDALPESRRAGIILGVPEYESVSPITKTFGGGEK